MLRLDSSTQPYDWGSVDAIPDLLGIARTGRPIAEAWMGAHPSAPSVVRDGTWSQPLDAYLAADPAGTLGSDVVGRFGPSLPYLLKVIAADRPLSLQVHPSIDSARAGFAIEDAAGIAVTDPVRNYRDRNHKPELVYALTPFEALCGFRAPRRVAELLEGLDAPLARDLLAVLRSQPTAEGIRTAFRRLLEPGMRPTPEQVEEVAVACRARLEAGSPSPRADRTVTMLAAAYPGDPGVVTSLLLNPVTLQPGDAMFVPAGGVHAYLSGVGIEVMASSDNVLRAGLTAKHIDIPELLANVDYVAAPPLRIAPEVFYGATKVFYAPVDDFELSVTTVEAGGSHPLPGRGPRVLLCTAGEVSVTSAAGAALSLHRGQSAFAPASDGPLTVCGTGTVVQADVP
ncbi:MAG: mannose-6-phosphate isomerase, class I [Cellulomonadaceae bacterium]|nr:mannose-6-phosphate isomerase, class I [Cellulomonadaceae bacterium]